jgi:hypothetical protein
VWREVRRKPLPARAVVYYVLGLALFSQASYEEVMRTLVDGLSWQSGWRRPWQVPSKAALFQARRRLGPEPLQRLFEQIAVPLATPSTAGAFYRDWRLVSIDGTCLDVADTAANAEAFGRPGSGRGSGSGAFPQLRVVGLAECGTHALVSAAIGPQRSSEQTLAAAVLDALGPGVLCLADRGFMSFSLWQRARRSGAELLWRSRTDRALVELARHPDGSYRSAIYASHEDRRAGREALEVRVIEYAIDDPARPANETRYRLLTTILDPDRAPADELAPLYAQRWEFENTLDELKVHQRGPRLVLRSKLPDGVRQEAYAYLCVHYAIRWLMHAVAVEAGHDPDRLSFTRTLRAARRTTASHAGLSPSDPERRP